MPGVSPIILLAGGGSGGHISPGLAIAERLRERGASEPVFACSERAIDAHMLRRAGACFVPLPAHPPAVRPRAAGRFVAGYVRSRRACLRLLAEHRVDHVVALGGFVAVPAVAAAHRRGIPVTLLNLDRPPGRANRWIAGRSDRVWSAVDLPDRPGFAERVVGLPIRRAALAPGPRGDDAGRARCRTALGLAADRPTLLVTGASQGAESVNRFLAALAETDSTPFDGWQVYHLAGSDAATPVRAAYARAGVEAVVEEFRDEMGLAWGAADLAVSRAGANSVAEVVANAVPTLFLPYPHHRDRHQRFNAEPVAALGGALLVDDHVETAANVRDAGAHLASLLRDEAARRTMRRRLLDHDAPDAAATIAALLVPAPDDDRSPGSDPLVEPKLAQPSPAARTA